MPDLTADSFKPYLGLSSIELAGDVGDIDLLPEASGMDPIDAAVEARLEAILNARDYERVMLDAIRPEVADRSILKPGRFHAIRRQILAKLEEAEKKDGEPAARQEEVALAQLLRKLGADHELGEHYRYALLKG